MLLSKEFAFKSAHKLSGNEGDPLHGHTYQLRVTIRGKVGRDGMVERTMTMKKIVDSLIVKKLDNTFLNDFLPQPTMENLAKWIWDELIDLGIHEIRVWENKDTFVTYNGND